MLRYLSRRLIGTLPLLLVISMLVFLFIHIIPGDPVRHMVDKEATGQEIEAMRDRLGLNDPLPIQYLHYLSDLFHGNLGTSYKTGLPVWDMLRQRIGATVSITVWAILWSVLTGTLIGVLSAVTRGRIPDYLGMVTAISGISAPGFWVGLVLINVFAVKLRWVPTGGLSSWRSYILPSITLGIGIMGVLARFSRSSMMESLQEDYVRTARAKGQREFMVVLRHAFRNSLMQVITVVGLQIGGLLAGSVLVETVFTIPGLGRLMVDSINFRDYTVIQSLLMFFSLEYIVINLLVDLLYGVLNPKVRVR
ncbi:glutathione ABC transporter permease GsiC [Clostridia bacterium]|nr:glutathione ABC transporter permease GsiC [Clostridia bacterium]